MNPRRMLARLNPKSQSFTGGGGIPEVMNADIAGALGMVRDGFARDVLCAVWWPEGASLIREKILQAVVRKQREEIERQSGEVYISRLELHLAASDTNDMSALAQMSAKVQRMETQMWDTRALVYMRNIGAAVFNEMSKPNTCRACDGVGYTIGKDKVHVCAKCDGAGILPLKLIDRAKMVGVSEKQYVRHGIRKVYEWTYSLVRDAEQSGAIQLQRALK